MIRYILYYNASQKHVSTLLQTYVLNEFLKAHRNRLLYIKILLKKTLTEVVAHFFTLQLFEAQ